MRRWLADNPMLAYGGFVVLLVVTSMTIDACREKTCAEWAEGGLMTRSHSGAEFDHRLEACLRERGLLELPDAAPAEKDAAP